MHGMTRVAIIGTGFGGLAAAVRLKQAGISDLVLLEKSDDVGGVWRENTYPGAACDVPSHLYSLSFAPKADWSRRFAPQAEIHQYLRDVARDFDVLRHIRFGTEVLAAALDEDSGTWRLTLPGAPSTRPTCSSPPPASPTGRSRRCPRVTRGPGARARRPAAVPFPAVRRPVAG